MPVKVIPEGSSAVVTDKDRHRRDDRDIIQNTYVTDDRRRDECNLDGEILTTLSAVAGFVKDTDAHITGVLADVAGFVKDTDAHLTGNIKDAEANLGTAMGAHFAGTIGAVKDAQSDLERSGGLHFAGTLQAVKDAQADLERSSGLHYADTVKTLKDVEAQSERSAGSRYADTVKTIKDTESTLERASALTRDVVRQAELAVEHSKAKIIDVLRDLELEQCKGFDNVKEEVQDARKELLFHQVTGFKDNLIEFKNTQNIMHQLAAAAEKTACQNQMQTLLQFKDQTLLAEKLAAQASRELAECCCEIRTSIAADGQKTRDLVNQQEVDRLRERASKAEQALALINLQIGNVGVLAKG